MGFPAEEIKERIGRAASEFGIEKLLDRKLFGLSGGEKQKIACGSIYAVDPDIYVFDEPSSNLDIASVNELGRIMEKLKAAGKTVILIEHRIYYAVSLADRIVYMRDGIIEKVFDRGKFLGLGQEELHQMGLRALTLTLPDFYPNDGEVMPVSPAGITTDVEALSFFYSDARFGRNQALNIRDLQLPHGKIIALTGENGAGKSTFLKCMCGLERGEKETIRGPEGILSRARRLKDSYLVMQDVNHQLFTESVKEEVMISTPKSRNQQRESTAERVLEQMGLSGGQKQRLAVAAACAAGKKYLYLDEPTSGLDYTQMKNTGRAVRKIRDKVSFVMIVTHDPEFVMECCDMIIELERGRVVRIY